MSDTTLMIAAIRDLGGCVDPECREPNCWVSNVTSRVRGLLPASPAIRGGE